MLNLTVNITGEFTEDLVIALEQVRRMVDKGCTSGHGRSTDSSFKFDVTEDEE